ncbi:MAG: CpXC domain-containing protein [Saccharofermentanales bacterium]|jgi:hypothetical protein|nr:CpXC domain-containing protein [Bacillota bacterium]
MKNIDQIKFKCPFCNADITSEYDSTINVTQNPELKEELFSGRIFLRECSECEKDIQIIYDFIYHDMDRKILLGFSRNPESFGEVISELMNSTDNEDFNFQTFYADYKIRAVADINDLFEKIYIFDDQLDDRAIELCKVFILQEWVDDPERKDLKIIGLKYLPLEVLKQEYAEAKDDLIGFNALTDNKKSLIIPLQRELYKNCEEHILSNLKSSAIEDNLIVNAKWLENNLNN